MKIPLVSYSILSLSALLISGCAGIINPDIEHYDPERLLADMHIELPAVQPPVANYQPAVRSGDMIYLSGHGPAFSDGKLLSGKIGQDLSTEQGREAARLTAISLLSTLKAEIGDLSRVKQIVSLMGMVNATPEFTEHAKVIDGCSNLLVEIFGERGKHARMAVGMASLPFNIPVEIQMIVKITEE